ncbi:MAG TPA: thiol:disulfide interchange protein DsbA/DsbL [Gammaproteobacteria bacterium]|jgi:thiol:disulfide interchange protein DsbA|nr:thiol:disulfide interchange protein DsbA/DsbL [Gammaproteobacteria bacterium]
MRSIAFLASVLLLAAGSAQADTYKQGVNYQTVLPAQPTAVNPGQIEVVDFFWYGCPHCNALEPYLESWERSKPANVVLKRVPAILQPDWEPAARAYYTAEALGILAKSHKATFDEIHQAKDVMQTEADFERFFVKQFGVDPKKFEATWSSPALDAKIAQANVLADRYGLFQFGVPTLVVNGKWLTGGDFGVPYSQIMLVVNQLVTQEQAAMPAAAK